MRYTRDTVRRKPGEQSVKATHRNGPTFGDAPALLALKIGPAAGKQVDRGEGRLAHGRPASGRGDVAMPSTYGLARVVSNLGGPGGMNATQCVSRVAASDEPVRRLFQSQCGAAVIRCQQCSTSASLSEQTGDTVRILHKR